MDHKRAVTNWDATLRLSKLLSYALVGSVIVNVALAVNQALLMERHTLIPPGLTDRATIERSKASESYLSAWGMYVATTLGSVTPSNALTVANLVGPQVDPKLWHSLRAQILSIADDPAYTRSGTFSNFVPTRVQTENNGYRIFVEGKLSELSYRDISKAVAINATYEMEFVVRSGLPILVTLNSYAGDARTALWKSKNASKLAEIEKAANKETERAKLRASRDEIMRAQDAEEERAAREKAATQSAPAAATQAPAVPVAPAASPPSTPQPSTQ